MDNEKRNWLIWSAEHQAFWRRDRMGYTINPYQAGLYTEAEAKEICDKANRYSNEPMEYMIRIEGSSAIKK